MDDKLAQEILRNIQLTGAASEDNAIVKPIVVTSEHTIFDQLLNRTSGLPRIRQDKLKQFNLIIQQPTILAVLNPFEIRCCLCKRVISYPAWYYSIKYAVSHFHFFICFDSNSSTKPSTRCMRRG